VLKVNKGISYKGLKKITLNDFLKAKQVRDTGLAECKAGSGQPRIARTDKNMNLFDELVYSQDTPESYNIVI